MIKNEEILNSLFVEVFNDILLIEQKTLKSGVLADLSVTEMHTIEAIGYSGARTMSEIASDLNITVGTLTTAINKLIKKEYVTRRRIESDRRVVLVELARKGKLAHRLHQRFHRQMIRSTIDSLSEEETKALGKALGNMIDFFKEQYPSEQN